MLDKPTDQQPYQRAISRFQYEVAQKEFWGRNQLRELMTKLVNEELNKFYESVMEKQ